MPSNKIIISELFDSIQGEGPMCGRPATFLRLAGCNLRCEWCDTKYAFSGESILISDLVEKLKQTNLARTRYLVITGGEPLIQTDALSSLLIRLPMGIQIGVETNGTIYWDPPVDANLHFVVSPKLSNSGTNGKDLFDPHWARTFATFKFVVASPEDIEEVLDFCARYRISKQRSWFMPKGSTRQEYQNSLSAIWDYCSQNSLRISPRLHIEAFDAKRGV